LTDLWLASRAIRHAIPATIRHHPSLEYRNNEGRILGSWPAMVVRLDDPAGDLIGIHRTWLDPSFEPGDVRKAPVPDPRKTLGSMGTAWFGRRDVAAIVVGEGVETTLAASELGGGGADPPEPHGCTPVACICSAGLARFEPPATCRRLYVAEDADPAGRAAAATLARRARERGITVTILREIHQ